MEIRLVDPRDTRWESDVTAYRVYFWSSDGGTCDEFEVSGATDVRDVLAWADTERVARTPEIFACQVQDGQRGLVRLSGCRPG